MLCYSTNFMLFNQFKNVSNGKYKITWGFLVVSFVCEPLIVNDNLLMIISEVE